MTPDGFIDLMDSWTYALESERKSAKTVKTYMDGCRAFLRWCEENDQAPDLDAATVNRFVADILAAGAEGTTARARQLAVRRFSAWLAEEGEIPADRIAHLKPPRLDVKVIPELDPDQCRALVKACRGPDFAAMRDEALVRLMLETGARAGEVVAMRVEDVDMKGGLATLRKAKGGKQRRVPFGPHTRRVLDRYLRRARKGHRLAETGALWLGEQGKGFGYSGLRKTLLARAEAAGIEGFTPHVLRHTFAGRWLDADGSEGGLMATAGWSNRSMIDRYTRATSERRAAEEARRLALGDL